MKFSKEKMKQLGLKRSCKGCKKMFFPKGKYTRFCDKCLDKIRGKKKK